MKGLSIKLPTKEVQLKLIKEIEKRENIVKESKANIAGIVKHKETLIKSYLTSGYENDSLTQTSEHSNVHA